jgi:hypothetical protein
MSELKKPTRPWRMIAEEISREFDHHKLTNLLEELNKAMEEQIHRPSGENKNGNGSGSSTA